MQAESAEQQTSVTLKSSNGLLGFISVELVAFVVVMAIYMHFRKK